MDIKIPRRKKPSDLSPAQQRRRMIVGLSVRAVVLFMLAIALLYAIISAIVGSSLFIPRSAEGVLDSVSQPSGYSWVSELTRDYEIAGVKNQYYQNSRFISLNTKTNKMQVVFSDVYPASAQVVERKLVSDGESARSLDNQDIERQEQNQDIGDTPWVLVNDFCEAWDNDLPDSPLSASLAAMPSPDLIKKADPEIVTDKATYRKDRAWLIGFRPTAEIVKQLMVLDLTDTTARSDSEKDFVLSGDERDALAGSGFQPIEGGATVTRNDREMTSIYIKFRLVTADSSSTYQILGQMLPEPQGDQVLGTLQKGTTDCTRIQSIANAEQ